MAADNEEAPNEAEEEAHSKEPDKAGEANNKGSTMTTEVDEAAVVADGSDGETTTSHNAIVMPQSTSVQIGS